jgi:acetyl esterase/lipase
LVAAWIYLPAPNYFLLRFGVGAPEISAWLILGSLVALGLSLPDLRSGRRPIATACSVVALLLSLTPLARFPGTARRFDVAMHSALGGDPLRAAPESVRGSMRPQPLILRDLFLGVPFPAALVARGLPVASPSGVPLTMNVYRPRRNGRFPILVQIYGGAWQRGNPDSFSNFAQWIAERGYVVFSVDYRHAPRWRWPAQLDDVRLALGWIHDHAPAYNADTARVALIGRSAGGHLALMAAYTPGPLRISAVISYYGPTDLVDAYFNPPHPDPLAIRGLEEALLGGTPREMPERYREASPITLVTHRLPPTLLVYGGRDHTVEPRYGERLAQRLTSSGTTAVYLRIPWAEHAFDEVFNGPSSQLALYHTERFLAWALSAPDTRVLRPTTR